MGLEAGNREQRLIGELISTVSESVSYADLWQAAGGVWSAARGRRREMAIRCLTVTVQRAWNWWDFETTLPMTLL